MSQLASRQGSYRLGDLLFGVQSFSIWNREALIGADVVKKVPLSDLLLVHLLLVPVVPCIIFVGQFRSTHLLASSLLVSIPLLWGGQSLNNEQFGQANGAVE